MTGLVAPLTLQKLILGKDLQNSHA
jgi:hypothetical protein